MAYIDVGYSLQWCTRKLVVREANTIACKTTDLGIKMECMNIPCCCRWWRSDIMVCSCHEGVLSLLQTCSNLLLLLWIKTCLNPNSLALRMASTSEECAWVGLRGFFDPTHHDELKKIQPNPTHNISSTQSTWVGLNPWVWQILLLLLLNWVEKNININILKKT